MMTSGRGVFCSIGLACLFAAAPSLAEPIEIASLEALAAYAAKDGNAVRMAPGVYAMTDYIPLEDIPERRENEAWRYIDFSGSGNIFDLTGVIIEFDTELREALDAPVHTPGEFTISGDDNTLKGLTIVSLGDGNSRQECVLSILGDRNTLRDCEFYVRGSYPYGYGDLFGKGGGPIIAHRKHSGVQIRGDGARLIGCRVYMRSYGHGFYVQGAANTYFEDCYVEGEMRSTNDMLAETSGPAFDVDFRSVYRNRDGEERVAPGYMKSLAEDGFRTYGDAVGVTFVNCVAKNMRGGFELRTSGPIRIENSAAIGNERGFWVGSDAIVTGSRGDARYGPVLFLEGEGSSVELALKPEDSAKKVHALATIHGAGHEVSITPWEGQERGREVPIKLGFSQPGAGEGMSPIGEREASDIALSNETSMPVIIGREARESAVVTRGAVLEDAGEAVSVTFLDQ